MVGPTLRFDPVDSNVYQVTIRQGQTDCRVQVPMCNRIKVTTCHRGYLGHWRVQLPPPSLSFASRDNMKFEHIEMSQEYLSSLVGKEVALENGHYIFPTNEPTLVEGYGNAKAFAKGLIRGRYSNCPLIVRESYNEQKGVKYFSINAGNATIFSTYSKEKLNAFINGYGKGLSF
jgi:hypothetical protein